MIVAFQANLSSKPFDFTSIRLLLLPTLNTRFVVEIVSKFIFLVLHALHELFQADFPEDVFRR